MGNDVFNVACFCNYIGVGIVEFFMDVDMNYYFLEMNICLQVEYLVMEFIIGVDLVE